MEHIDYIISTHPHVDHVGGIAAVPNAVTVEAIYTPVLEWDSKTFSAMLKYADLQGTPLIVPYEGDTFQLGNATVTILHCWPEAINENRTNDSSIVTRITYGNTDVIIAGDAEDWSEYMMIDAMHEYPEMYLKADVLRVAHHGSRYSSTMEFLEAVQPQYAVISSGKDNEYRHPHQEVLERLDEIGCTVLRTDELGTIIMESDGNTISIK